SGDFGVVAHDDDVPVGAAWCRFFDAGSHGYGFVSADVPELTIGVVAGRRGEGIGRVLLTGLIDEARQRGVASISLSVEADNPAVALYLDVGFVEVSRVADSPTMVLDCRTA
ncbi:MAG: GNAT family N-acetyltransferase, partial [Ilumatobacter sp.]